MHGNREQTILASNTKDPWLMLIGFANGGTSAVSVNAAGDVAILDVNSGQLLDQWKLPTKYPVFLSDDGGTFLGVGSDGLTIWNIDVTSSNAPETPPAPDEEAKNTNG